MAKSKFVKQRLQDGTYEDVYFATDGNNVEMSYGYTLEEVIGSVDVENVGDIQTQFNKLREDAVGLWIAVDSWSE